MGFETLQGRLDPRNRRCPVQKPAGFENQTIQFPDHTNAQIKTLRVPGVPWAPAYARTAGLPGIRVYPSLGPGYAPGPRSTIGPRASAERRVELDLGGGGGAFVFVGFRPK